MGLVIDGKEVATPDRSPIHDPAAPSEVVGYAALATPDQAREAIDAAERNCFLNLSLGWTRTRTRMSAPRFWCVRTARYSPRRRSSFRSL